MITLKKLKTTFYLFKLQDIKDLAPPYHFPNPPFLKVGLAPTFLKVDWKRWMVLSHNKIPA